MTKKKRGNNGFKVDSGVPLPDIVPGSRLKYPLADMKVDDSFEVRGEVTMRRARNAAYLYGRRHKRTYACRKVAGKRDAWRIWRTA